MNFWINLGGWSIFIRKYFWTQSAGGQQKFLLLTTDAEVHSRLYNRNFLQPLQEKIKYQELHSSIETLLASSDVQICTFASSWLMQGVSWRVTQKPPARLLSPDAGARRLCKTWHAENIKQDPFHPFHQLRAICLCFPVEQQTLTFEWRLALGVFHIYINQRLPLCDICKMNASFDVCTLSLDATLHIPFMCAHYIPLFIGP